MKDIRNALSKCDDKAGVPEVDKRGSRNNHYSAADQEELASQHIKLFKVVESYCTQEGETGQRGENSLVGQGIVTRIRRFPVQTSLGAWLGLGTQPHYQVPVTFESKLK